MTTKSKTARRYTSTHSHIEQAGRTYRMLLNIFALMVMVAIAFAVSGAVLLQGQL